MTSIPLDIKDKLKQCFAEIVEEHFTPVITPAGINAATKEIMAFAEQIVNRAHASQTDKDKVACRAGCSSCCHTIINITPVETLLIHNWIESNYSAAERDALSNRIRALLDLTRGRTLQQRVLIRTKNPPASF